MKSIELKKYRISGAKHCFIVKEGHLIDQLCSKYGRRVGLKIFDVVEVKSEEDFYNVKWGDDPKDGEPRVNSKLFEATQIQNIASWHGLAPRVYGLETVWLGEAYRPAQVIEILEDDNYQSQDEAFKAYQSVQKVGEKYHFKIDKSDISAKDAMHGKLIDFQTFAFTQDYKETVKEIICEDGRYGKVYYQDVPELGLGGGPRKSERRAEELGLNLKEDLKGIKDSEKELIDFKGKTVWDVGCAGGFFTRLAAERGAKRVTGFDMEGPVNAARHTANALGYFNIDYEVADLSKEKVFIDYPRPDILFFLSMNFHIGYPEFIKYCPFVVFEDNGKESRNWDNPGSPFNTWFDNIKFIGRCTDHGSKAIYHLWH